MIFDGEPGLEIDEDESYWEPLKGWGGSRDVWKCWKRLRSPPLFRVDVYMGVSKNRGTPKSSILMGFSIINHPFWGIFGNTHIYIYINIRIPGT